MPEKKSPMENKRGTSLSSYALDESQRQFCSIDGDSIRLLAPAGSGKTHSLLWRCKALLELSPKTKPRFLLFTFTRAARDELRDRIRSMISLPSESYLGKSVKQYFHFPSAPALTSVSLTGSLDRKSVV